MADTAGAEIASVPKAIKPINDAFENRDILLSPSGNRGAERLSSLTVDPLI